MPPPSPPRSPFGDEDSDHVDEYGVSATPSASPLGDVSPSHFSPEVDLLLASAPTLPPLLTDTFRPTVCVEHRSSDNGANNLADLASRQPFGAVPTSHLSPAPILPPLLTDTLHPARQSYGAMPTLIAASRVVEAVAEQEQGSLLPPPDHRHADIHMVPEPLDDPCDPSARLMRRATKNSSHSLPTRSPLSSVQIHAAAVILSELCLDTERQRVRTTDEIRLINNLLVVFGTRCVKMRTQNAVRAVLDSLLAPNQSDKACYERHGVSANSYYDWKRRIMEIPLVLPDATVDQLTATLSRRSRWGPWYASKMLAGAVLLTILVCSMLPPCLFQRGGACSSNPDRDGASDFLDRMGVSKFRRLMEVQTPLPVYRHAIVPVTAAAPLRDGSTMSFASDFLSRMGTAATTQRPDASSYAEQSTLPGVARAGARAMAREAPTLNLLPRMSALPAFRPPMSRLAVAARHNARATALRMFQGPSDMAFNSEVAASVLSYVDTIHDYSDLGINASTAKKDERAWGMWEVVAEAHGTSPLRTADDVREFPQRNAHLLAALMFHAVAVCKPRSSDRDFIKPASAFAYPLAIIRIFARWGITMPSYKLLKAAVSGLAMLYVDRHGPRSLIPTRKEPMKFRMVRAMNDIPTDGRMVGNFTWTDDAHDVFIFRRLNVIAIHTAQRLHELRTLTLGALSWRIGGLMILRPTRQQLRQARTGDKVFMVVPLSKTDSSGEIHCPFPIALTLDFNNPINPALALLNIELNYGADVADRESHPLFATASGDSYSASFLDALLTSVLTHLYGAKVAALYTWHSYRSGLATALHASGVPDDMIQLICRWMCPESLRVYRRIGSIELDRYLANASQADVDLIQAANIVRVDADAGYAQLTAHYARYSRFEQQAYDVALTGQADVTPTPGADDDEPPRTPARARTPPATPGTAPRPAPAAPAAPPVAVQLAPLAANPAVGDHVVVPATLWPRYHCEELNGQGWEAIVRSASQTTVVVRFLYAHTRDGRLYADERLPSTQLVRRI